MDKPTPKPTKESSYYWEGCCAHELRYQYCESCQRAQFPPSARCRNCHTSEIKWRKSDLRGTVHSFSLVHRAPTKAFVADVPYYVGLIDMDEGFRIMTNVQPINERKFEIGAPVQIFFEKRDNATVLPQARIVTKTEN
ncbi:MAG: hypothetical protein GWP67_14035 [Gammaproteobacteria bacterium]|jgi:uncharacterized OB-fold protein|nr:hypothetical protein [Gammaproteobacteria bacterium]